MGMPVTKTRHSVSEYLRMERDSLEKHEFDDGEILAMAGATPKHVRIASNLIGELHSRLKSKPCQPYGSDLRIAMMPGRRHAYPDISIICGPLDFDPADERRETATNARAIVEVLSPSTERYDRTRKFDAYRRMETFQEYVLVAQDIPRIETFFRQADGTWAFDAFSGIEAVTKLRSIEVNLPLAEVYAGVEFPPAAELDAKSL